MTALTFLMFGFLSVAPGDSQNPHAIFTTLLQEYVHDGQVDYQNLCDDDRLQIYLTQLENTDPDTIADKDARLAFWINAYNAFTLKVICDGYPVDSINDLHWGGLIVGTIFNKTIWDKKFIRIGGGKLSLNNIEHDIIRKQFDDPRIHFALVCAAKSCPPLRAEAYTGARLDEQLNEQARIFFGQESKNRFDVENKTAYLSKIMDWYDDDFADNDEGLLLYVAQFLPERVAEAIKADPHAWDIEHTHYDWSLNE